MVMLKYFYVALRQGRTEGNVLFNDALNIFYLWLYGIGDHSHSKRGNPLLHGLLFPINSKGSFICTIPQKGLHIPRCLLHQSWSTGWKIAQWVHPMMERSYHGATSRSSTKAKSKF